MHLEQVLWSETRDSDEPVLRPQLFQYAMNKRILESSNLGYGLKIPLSLSNILMNLLHCSALYGDVEREDVV